MCIRDSNSIAIANLFFAAVLFFAFIKNKGNKALINITLYSALLIGIFGAVPYAHLAFESIFMLGFLFLMLGVIIYTNVKMEVMDNKAIVIKKKTLFDTSVSFNIGAIASIGTVVGLYIIFW